jgi:Tol biopolymer transport system component
MVSMLTARNLIHLPVARTSWVARRVGAVAFVVATMLLSPASAADIERLTHDGRQKWSPTFRDKGRDLVFVEFVDPTLFQIRRLTLATGQVEPLHPAATASEFEPAWSADGECYAYCKLRGVLSISVMVRSRSGTDIAEILPDNGFCGYRSPALSPDHLRLVFSYAENGSQQIVSCRLNGDDRRPLAEARGISNWPAYSPDGKSIAFGSSRDGNFEIYVMHADGTDLRRLTEDPFQDVRPRFSPDGKRIAFTSHRDGNAEIYVMDADGSNQQRVTECDELDDYADWHPDGERLVFVGERGGKQDLYLVPAPPMSAMKD